MTKVVAYEKEVTPDHVRVFCQFMATDVENCTVAHLNPAGIPQARDVERALGNDEIKDTVIIFIDCGELSTAGKLLALLVRNRTVNLIACQLRRHDLNVVGSYALYPSAKRVTFVYERNTAAARYAESMLLTAPGNALLRRAYAALSRTSLGAPSIELVAVVGRRA